MMAEWCCIKPLFQGKKTMEKRHLEVVAPPPRPALRLDAEHIIRTLLPEKDVREARLIKFEEDEVLVRQGEVSQFAYLVKQGVLIESQQRTIQGNGNAFLMIRELGPGNTAFIQALTPGYEMQPAQTTVKAKKAGMAYALDISMVPSTEPSRRLVLESFRAYCGAVEALWQQELDMGALGEILRELGQVAEHAQSENLITRWTSAQALLKEMAMAFRDAKNAGAEVSRLTEENAQLRQKCEMLEEQLLLARRENTQLVALSTITAFEQERKRSALRWFGAEVIIDRLLAICKEAGREETLTEDEGEFLHSEDMEKLQRMADGIKRSRKQATDAEINAMLACVGVAPTEEVPAERAERTTLTYEDQRPAVPAVIVPTIQKPPNIVAGMTLPPPTPNLVLPAHVPPPMKTEAPEDDDLFAVDWPEDPSPPAETEGSEKK
jgi:hypothetical protein